MLEKIGISNHEIFCWSWAVGICAGAFLVMMMIDTAWTSAYRKGFEDGRISSDNND